MPYVRANPAPGAWTPPDALFSSVPRRLPPRSLSDRSLHRRLRARSVTYLNDLGLPPAFGNFEILVDGTSVTKFQPNASATGFFDVRYALPPDVVRGKAKVTVKFQAAPNGRVAPVFGVRTIKSGG